MIERTLEGIKPFKVEDKTDRLQPVPKRVLPAVVDTATETPSKLQHWLSTPRYVRCEKNIQRREREQHPDLITRVKRFLVELKTILKDSWKIEYIGDDEDERKIPPKA